MQHFHVLSDPWIPVVDKGGQTAEVGLRSLLEEAHHLDAIVEAAPPMQAGIYRLVIAFVQDALRLRDPAHLADLLAAGSFDMAAIDRYIAEAGADRFDLFHADRPFLQTPRAARPAGIKPVADLFFHLPTGSSVTHFHHMRETDHAISPAVCARALCALAPFMTAGGAGYSPSINGTPPYYLLIRGQNLYETILLNTCVLTQDLPLGAPSWRSDRPFVPKAQRSCQSLLEGLTWQVRQVRLLPGQGGVCTYTGRQSEVLIREIAYGPGLKPGAESAWRDPHVAYRTAEKAAPLRPQAGRALWRDTASLLLASSRPRIIDQLVWLQQEHGLALETWLYEVYAMRVDKAKVFEWVYERLALPPGVLSLSGAGAALQEAVQAAEAVAYDLQRALRRAYPDGAARPLELAQGRYWERLAQPFWERLLQAMAAAEGPELLRAALADWLAVVEEQAKEALEEALGYLGSTFDGLRAQEQARGALQRRLRQRRPMPLA